MYAYLKFMDNIDDLCNDNILKIKYLLGEKLNKEDDQINQGLKLKIKFLFLKIEKLLLNGYINISIFIKRIFNVMTIKKTYNGYIFTMPYSVSNIKKENNTRKLIKRKNENIMKNIFKIKRISNKCNINHIIISKEIKQVDDEFKNKKIMKCMVKEIFEHILSFQDNKIELQDIYIVTKEYNKFNESNIVYLAKFFRTINIVTTKIYEYKRLASKLEKTDNTLITVSDNKAKSLKKAKYIVNVDLDREEINKYSIYRNAIIVNLQETDEDNFYNRKRV